MTEINFPAPRIHRVTTRRHTLRPLDCPLDAELLVAEFSGELPPDVTLAVREHVAVCETCGERARTLRLPYDLLSTLGSEPVPYVPDLRDSVRQLSRAQRGLRLATRLTASLGRGGTIALTAVSGLVLLAVVVALVVVLPARAQVAGRSANGLSGVPAAAAHGTLYAETNKLVTVTDATGGQWQAAEVIAVSEHNAQVTQSLPASDLPLHVASANQLPVAVTLAQGSVAELTAPRADGRQALVVFDAHSGAVQHIVPIVVPGQSSSTPRADALAVSPDGALAYVGLDTSRPAHGGARVLVLSLKSGGFVATLSPTFSGSIPLPPPPGSLPTSAFPSAVPYLQAGGYTDTLGLGGALVISPDGQWLFDSLLLTSSKGEQYLVVRRFSATTGKEAQELGLPGSFNLARIAASPSANSPEIYVAIGSPNAQLDVLSATATGPSLIGDVPLGGPVAPSNATFSGTLQLLPTEDGTRVFVGQNVTQTNGPSSGHDLWAVDTQGMGLLVHRTDAIDGGVALLNGPAASAKNAFLLHSGQIGLISPDLTKDPVPWLRLSDGHDVVALLGTA